MYERSRILVVDDDRALLDIAEETIGDSFDVMLAVSGKQALEILGNETLRGGGGPELIILDIEMPGMDGYETLKRIRGIPAFAETPVIFLTGFTGFDAELYVLRHGAQDYITKPFARENLLARISLRLESGRQSKQLQELRKRSENDEKNFAALTKDLTQSEREVARLITLGFGNQEIARRLNYSPGYVKNLATLIYGKLDVRGRGELRALLQKY